MSKFMVRLSDCMKGPWPDIIGLLSMDPPVTGGSDSAGCLTIKVNGGMSNATEFTDISVKINPDCVQSEWC